MLKKARIFFLIFITLNAFSFDDFFVGDIRIIGLQRVTTGSIFNIISAWLALFSIFFFFGIVNFLPIIGSVMENSAAYNNDLREGDRILEINNKNIEEFSDIPRAIGNSNTVNMLIERENKIINKSFDLIIENVSKNEIN